MTLHGFIRVLLRKPKQSKKLLDAFTISASSTFFVFYAIFSSTLPAAAFENDVVVSLFKAHKSTNGYYLNGPFMIKKPSPRNIGAGSYKLSIRDSGFILSKMKEPLAQPIFIASHEIQVLPKSATLHLGFKPDSMRRYRGSVTFTMMRGQITCRNELPMKDYLCSVVGSESRIEFPEEALKAQSVLVQTLMARYKRGDDLNDSTEKQAYLGADYERAEVRAALQKTWGEILKFKGSPLTVYFHACCAGATSSSALFCGETPKLSCDSAVKCGYCIESPFWKEKKQIIPAAVFRDKFPEGIPEIVRKDSSGRPLAIKFPLSGRRTSGYDFWLSLGQKLGWDKMPGSRYQIGKLANGDIELRSTGAGHGVGLCQWGACGAARSGMKYEEILYYYFPGSRLSKG